MPIHRYGLISDTHGRLHPGILEWFVGVDAIFHAGDIDGDDILAMLRALAPVHAVAGNVDPPGAGLPLLIVKDFPFGRAALLHGHLHEAGLHDPNALAASFAQHQPRVIIHGHTHIARFVRAGEVIIVNPGSAGKPRFRVRPSAACMIWDDEQDKLTFELLPLEWR